MIMKDRGSRINFRKNKKEIKILLEKNIKTFITNNFINRLYTIECLKIFKVDLLNFLPVIK
jgi:hypothetical protein